MPTLEILHWNDIHGRWAELARLSARSHAIRAEADHPVLLLDGGDVEEGSVRLSALTKGVAGWRLLGAAGVDAAVVGNGGLLRYGPGVLPEYAAALHSPPLMCDVDLAGSAPAGAARSHVVTIGDVRVGLIGATDYYPQYDDFGLAERGRVTAVRAEADLLRRQGVNAVVLLSHCGLDADRALSWSLRGLVDLIVGGHSHHVLDEGDLSQGVPIVQAGCYGERLGRVTLDLSAEGVRVVDIRHEVASEDWPGDPAVLAELAACESDLEAWLGEPVAVLDEPAPWQELRDSAVARLLTEAVLAAYPGDVGMLIAGHCTAGMPAGAVTRGDVWAATSSPGNAATGSLTGSALRAMVLKGVSDEYATTLPRALRGRPYGALHLVGAEMCDGELYVGGLPVDDSRVYRVTGSDLELSTYGLLVDADPDDLVVHTPAILPELLESHLRGRRHHQALGEAELW